MKKKGLIIATIVMVLVLAVSLTTATYAWFSNQANTTVDTINVNIASASDIDIGVTNTYKSADQEQYLYESITSGSSSNAINYTAGTVGLGTQLSLGEVRLTTAVATTANLTDDSTTATYRVIDDSFDPANTIFKAAAPANQAADVVGNPDWTSQDTGEAIANSDYIALQMGARAAKADIKGIYGQIKVATTGTATTLKMNAALHLYLQVGDSGVDIDVFGSKGKYNTPKTQASVTTMNNQGAITGVSYELDSNTNQVVATINFFIAGEDTSTDAAAAEALSTSTINALKIYAFVYGPDDACVSVATGCTCTIDISFNALRVAGDYVDFVTIA